MTAVPGPAAPPGFPPSPAPGHGRPFSGDNPHRRAVAAATHPVRTVRYDSGEFPPLFPGSTLAGAVAQALRQGRPVLPAVDREGRVVGVFDLPGFLSRLSPRGRADLDAPVGPILEKAAAVVAPGHEEAWARDGASETAVVAGADGRYLGVLFREEGAPAPSRRDQADAWLRQVAEGLLADVSYMVAVADPDGRVVLANEQMRQKLDAIRDIEVKILERPATK